MKVIYLFFFLYFTDIVLAQTIPDDIAKLSDRDTSKTGKLLKIAYKLQYTDSQSSEKYAKKVIELAKKQECTLKQAEAYFLLSELNMESLEYAKANKNAIKSLEVYQNLNQPRNIAKIYEQLGTIYDHLTNYATALEYHFKALHIFEKLKDKKSHIDVLGSIASSYFNLDDYKNSLKYDFRALKLAKIIQDSVSTGRYYAAIAVNYLEMQDYKKSLPNYLKALDYLQPEKTGVGIYYFNQLGLVYYYLGNFKKGQEYHAKAWILVKSKPKSLAFLEYHLDVGESYHVQGRYKKALEYYLKGVNIAQKQNVQYFVYDFYDRIIKTYKQSQKYEQAFVFQEKFMSLKDSIYSQNKARHINEMQAIYESSKKEEEIKTQKSELKRQEIQQLLLIIIIIFILLFSLYLFYANYQRLKKNKILSSQKEEIQLQAEELKLQSEELKTVNEALVSLDNFKEQMTGMIVHDLKNPLNSVIALSENENLAQKEHQVIHQSGQQMLTMVSNMLDVYKFEESEIQLNIEESSLSEIINLALSEVGFLAKQKSLTILNEIETDYLFEVDIDLLKRVFVNLLTNAIKYSPNNAKVWIKVEELENTEIKIFIQDEGIGISKENQTKIFDKYSQVEARKSGKTRSTGLGLTFCKMVVEAHQGEISVISEEGQGTSFWFTIQASKQNELNQVMTESIHQSFNYLFTQEEKKYLATYLKELQNIELYEASKIMLIVENIRKQASPTIQKWANELENTVFTYNEETYKNLISI